MIKEIYGKKVGMTQIFGDTGDRLTTTLVEIEPVCVLEKIDYPKGAVAKIGCFKLSEKKADKVSKPIKGYFAKIGVPAYKLIKEVAVDKDASFSFDSKDEAKIQQPSEELASEANDQNQAPDESKESKVDEPKEGNEPATSEEVEQKINRNPREFGVEIFKAGELLNIRAKSKGRGFAGGMKKYGWAGQPGGHGSTMHRRPGSIGASAYPSRVMKGKHMPGHMGDVFRTVKNLKILKVDQDKNLLFIEGSIPGSRGTLVKLSKVK